MDPSGKEVPGTHQAWTKDSRLARAATVDVWNSRRAPLRAATRTRLRTPSMASPVFVGVSAVWARREDQDGSGCGQGARACNSSARWGVRARVGMMMTGLVVAWGRVAPVLHPNLSHEGPPARFPALDRPLGPTLHAWDDAGGVLARPNRPRPLGGCMFRPPLARFPPPLHTGCRSRWSFCSPLLLFRVSSDFGRIRRLLPALLRALSPPTLHNSPSNHPRNQKDRRGVKRTADWAMKVRASSEGGVGCSPLEQSNRQTVEHIHVYIHK